MTAAAQAQQPADVFVVFGITGDLARVMTFRSLYRLEARGLLDCPIVGVAVDDWSLERPARARPRPDRGHRRGDRRGGVRAVRGPAVLRAGRLRRRRHLPAGGRRRSAARPARSSTWRSPVPFGTVVKGLAERGLTDRAGSSWRSPSATTSSPPGRWPPSCTSTSTSRSCTASTTTSARWATRRSSTCASPTPCSSRCGTAATSSVSRSPWPRTSASRTAATSTTRSARCATSSSTT